MEELARQWPDVYRRRLSNSATLDSLIRKMSGRPDMIQAQIGPDALMLATQVRDVLLKGLKLVAGG